MIKFQYDESDVKFCYKCGIPEGDGTNFTKYSGQKYLCSDCKASLDEAITNASMRWWKRAYEFRKKKHPDLLRKVRVVREDGI